MTSRPHRCSDGCVCPVHGTPLIYWPAGDDHACQDGACIYAYGVDWADDIGNLYILESITAPLPVMLPSERRERERIYRESGELTREMIVRLLAGEFS